MDLEDFDEETAYATYDSFGVANEQQKYRLVRLGQYTGKTFSLTPAGGVIPYMSNRDVSHKVLNPDSIKDETN